MLVFGVQKQAHLLIAPVELRGLDCEVEVTGVDLLLADCLSQFNCSHYQDLAIVLVCDVSA